MKAILTGVLCLVVTVGFVLSSEALAQYDPETGNYLGSDLDSFDGEPEAIRKAQENMRKTEERIEEVQAKAQLMAEQAEKAKKELIERHMEIQVKAQRAAGQLILQADAGAQPSQVFNRSARVGRWVANSNKKIDAALNQLKSAKSDEEKDRAKEQLSELLAEQFSQDMKQREQEIEKVEQRVKKLRAQFNKRQVAKESIIKLQLQVLENEAAGLGFYDVSSTDRKRKSAYAARPATVTISTAKPLQRFPVPANLQSVPSVSELRAKSVPAAPGVPIEVKVDTE